MSLRERLADLNVESRFASDKATGLPVSEIISVVPTPPPPTVDVIGARGTTSYTYAIAAGSQFGDTPPSDLSVITTGNAVLSATNLNRLNWQPVPGATLYRVLKLVAGVLALVATVNSPTTTFDDVGAATSPFTQATVPPPKEIRIFNFVFDGTNWVPELTAPGGPTLVAIDVNPDVGGVEQTPTFVPISAALAGANQIVAAVAAKTIRVLSLTLVASAAVSVKWQSGTTDISGLMTFVANGGYSNKSMFGLFATAANQALNLNLSVAVQVGGHLSYVTV